MLMLAMSCLQGRTQDDAFGALMRHRPAGIQLTPGNLPSPGFRARVAKTDVAVRTHHGFAWDCYRRPVFDAQGEPIAIERDRSVHAPRCQAPPTRRTRARPSPLVTSLQRWLPIALRHDLLVETMTPGYVLGTGAQLEEAMAAGLRLAVDVAHLAIQRHGGALTEATERRLLNYDRVEEIHVSTSVGRRDAHRPLRPDTPGLAWARERLAELPVVLECRWHRLPFDAQRRQLAVLRG